MSKQSRIEDIEYRYSVAEKSIQAFISSPNKVKSFLGKEASKAEDAIYAEEAMEHRWEQYYEDVIEDIKQEIYDGKDNLSDLCSSMSVKDLLEKEKDRREEQRI
jgi:hypothetical protein